MIAGKKRKSLALCIYVDGFIRTTTTAKNVLIGRLKHQLTIERFFSSQI